MGTDWWDGLDRLISFTQITSRSNGHSYLVTSIDIEMYDSMLPHSVLSDFLNNAHLASFQAVSHSTFSTAYVTFEPPNPRASQAVRRSRTRSRKRTGAGDGLGTGTWYLIPEFRYSHTSTS